jgi:hypothetical protein
MANVGVDGTMYNVAPIGINSLLPPTVLNTSTTATIGNGATTIVTSPTLPAGTYFVGGNFSATSSTTFTATDTINFRIHDGAGSVLYYPQSGLTGYSGIGSTPAAIINTVSGVMVLATSGTLIWDTNCSFTTSTGKTGGVNNAFYQRIS